MKVKILSNFDYQVFPITKDMIDVDDDILKEIGISKQFVGFDGKVIDYHNTEDLKNQQLIELRSKREAECFPIINRGKLWYEKLTEFQLGELDKWYTAWLNVTDTLIEPVKPSWLK